MNRIAIVLLFLLGSTASAQGWVEEPIDLQSAHPYAASPAGNTYLLHRPGAESIRIYFERIEIEDGWDTLEVTDAQGRTVQRLTGAAERFWSEPVRGEEVTLRLVTDRTGSGYGFRATRVSYRIWNRSPIIALRLYNAGRELRPSDRITIESGGYLDLTYRGLLPGGLTTDRGVHLAPLAEVPEGPAPIRVEALPEYRLRLHATGPPIDDVPLRIRDSSRARIEAKCRLTVLAPPPPPVPQPRWIQIGQTQTLPSFARDHQDMDIFFVAAAGTTGCDQVKILAHHPIQVRDIRIDFKDGTRQVVFQGSHPLMTGGELAAGIPAADRSREILRVRVRVRGRGEAQLLVHARIPPN